MLTSSRHFLSFEILSSFGTIVDPPDARGHEMGDTGSARTNVTDAGDARCWIRPTVKGSDWDSNPGAHRQAL